MYLCHKAIYCRSDYHINCIIQIKVIMYFEIAQKNTIILIGSLKNCIYIYIYIYYLSYVRD